MSFYVYLLITKRNYKYITYVGYAKDINKRVFLHNNSKGAKFTKGSYWKLIYKRKYLSKNIAMKEEFKLKKNYRLRKIIKDQFLEK